MSVKQEAVHAPPSQWFDSIRDYTDIFRIILDGSLGDWGVAYSLMRAGEKKYWFLASERFTEFCRRLRGTEQGDEQCLECTVRHANEAGRTGMPISYICDAGLIDIAVPLFVNGDHIATIMCGQRRPEKGSQDDREGLERARHTAARLGLNEELMALREQVPELSQEQVERLKRKLEEVGRYVTRLMQDKIQLEKREAESQARLKENQTIRQIAVWLQPVSDVNDFWLRLDKALGDIAKTLGASCGLILVSEQSDEKMFVVKAVTGLPRKAFAERAYTEKSVTDLESLPNDEPFTKHVAELVASETCVLCRDVAKACKQALDGVIIVPLDLGGGQRGLLVLYGEHRREGQGGLSFDEEKSLLLAIRPQIVGAYQNCRLFSRQKQLDEEKTRYIQDVTHQLVQPLAGIEAHCENITNPAVPFERKKNIPKYLMAMARMCAGFARNFAWAAEKETDVFDRDNVTFEPTKLSKVLIDCAIDMQGFAASEDVSIHVDTDSVERLPRVPISLLHFRQAVHNLLYNAVKYSYPDTTIVVSASQAGDRVSLRFENIGIPIEMEYREKIFKRGFRTEQARKKAAIGTGIGLFVVREVAKLHGGEVFVESSEAAWVGYRNVFAMVLPTKLDRKALPPRGI